MFLLFSPSFNFMTQKPFQDVCTSADASPCNVVGGCRDLRVVSDRGDTSDTGDTEDIRRSWETRKLREGRGCFCCASGIILFVYFGSL